MANHNLPKIKGYPLIGNLCCRTMESMGYCNEYMDITTYSNIPSSLMVDISTSKSILRVCLGLESHMAYVVSRVMKLMEAPRLINVLGMNLLFIYTLKTRLRRSEYLVAKTPPIITSNNLSMTWIVLGSFLIQLRLIKQSSLTTCE